MTDDIPTSRCPVAGCTRSRKLDQLMCRAHWREVPVETQRTILRCWRAIRSGSTDMADRHAAINEYRDVTAAAIAALAPEPDQHYFPDDFTFTTGKTVRGATS